MQAATISADIIAYTSLSERNKRKIEEGIRLLINQLSYRYQEQEFYGRLVQGDYIECALLQPEYALRIVLLLKTFIKSFQLEPQNKNIAYRNFVNYGVRIAVAVAPLEVLNAEKGIIDGEAIYQSGRALQHKTTANKEKVSIKETLYFYSPNIDIQEKMAVIFALLDDRLNKNSAKQCEVIFHKLQMKNEIEIAEILKKSQSTINQHSNAGGWNAIESAVNYFEKTINNAY